MNLGTATEIPETAEVTIREPITKLDYRLMELLALRAIYHTTEQAAEGTFRIFLRPDQMLARTGLGARYCVAEVPRPDGVGTSIVGMLEFAHDSRREYTHLVSLYVDPEWHRKGIGRRLVQTVISAATHAQLAEIRLNSSEYAVPFYLALGFEATGKPTLNAGKVFLAMKRTGS